MLGLEIDATRPGGSRRRRHRTARTQPPATPPAVPCERRTRVRYTTGSWSRWRAPGCGSCLGGPSTGRKKPLTAGARAPRRFIFLGTAQPAYSKLAASGAIGGAERLVRLDEPTVGHEPDDASLHAAGQHLPVVLLQAQADSIGEVVGQRRQDDQPDPAGPGHRVRTDVESGRDDVAGAGGRQHEIEHGCHGAQAGPGRHVPGTLEQMVVLCVPVAPRFDERIGHRQHEQDARQHHRRPEHRRDGVSPTDRDVELPGRHQTARSVEEHQVPVGAAARAHHRRPRRAGEPDRADLQKTTQQRDHTEHEAEEAGPIERVSREQPLPHHVGVGAARAAAIASASA